MNLLANWIKPASFTSIMKKIKSLHPLLFAVYPVLAMWAENKENIVFSQTIRSFIFVLSLCALIWLLASAALRDTEKGGLITSVALLISFSYGHVYNSLEDGFPEIGRHRILLPASGLLFLLWCWIVRKSTRTAPLTLFFSTFGILLLLAPLYTLSTYSINASVRSTQVSPFEVALTQPGNRRPDIYYIIVDGYGREDVLLNLYNHDNSAFTGFLREKGFYVADESTSNYRLTLLSLASSLNMSYLQELVPDLDQASNDYAPFIEKIWHSRVRQILAEQGYRLVSVDSGFLTTIANAEVIIAPQELTYEAVDLEREGYWIDLNEFEGLLIDTTLARLWVDWQVKQGKANVLNLVAIEGPYNRHRARVLFMINSVEQITPLEGDYFVFIHIFAPHPPFVFGPNGEQVRHTRFFTNADSPKDGIEAYLQGYSDQLTYLNVLLEQMINHILETSDPKPIIIIQGDHGPRAYEGKTAEETDLREAFGILNAYYFPDGNYSALYPSITPVNSFAVVLNNYLGTDFDLKEDHNFWSTYKRPFQFQKIERSLLLK